MMHAHQLDTLAPGIHTTLYISFNGGNWFLSSKCASVLSAIHLQIQVACVDVGINKRLAALPPPCCHLPDCLLVKFCNLQCANEVQLSIRGF